MQKKLVIFFLTHFTYGMIFNMFGPIIPYLAESTGQTESEFTYIFVLRGVSYLAAGFCQQSFLKDYCLYKRMLISCLVSGISFFFLHLIYPYYLLSSFVCLIMFFANGSIEVLINVLLMTATAQDAKTAISFSYGFYGIGGVMGSIIVSIFGVNALMFGAIWVTLVGMLYFDLVTFKKKQKQALHERMINTEIITSQLPEKRYLNSNLEKMFCILFCLYAAISLSYRSWLPSFIVMQNLATKQVAAISISIYSGFLTLFRFIFMFWSVDIIKSLNFVSSALIVALFCSLASYLLNIEIVLVYGSSIVLGVLFSSYVPYLYALPSEFKMNFTQKGTCNTIITYAIGQAVISALIGCMMEWFHPIMLFAMMFLFSLLNKYYMSKTIESLYASEKQILNPEQTQMKRFS